MLKKVLVSFLVMGLTACGLNQVAMVETTKQVETTQFNETTTKYVDSEVEVEIETKFDESKHEETMNSLIEETGKWSSYSDEIRAIIEKAVGKDYATSKTLTKEERNKLHSVGLYMITKDVTQVRNNDTSEVFSSGGSTEFLTRDDLVDFLTSKYSKFRNEKLGFEALNFAIWDSAASDIYREVKTNVDKGISIAKVEAKQKLAESYVKVNTDPNSPAKYINGLGNGQYTIKFGLVVPSTPVDVHDPASNYSYIPKENFETFCKTEVLCFQKNNEGKIINVIGKQPKVKYGVNTYNQYGDPVWIIREQNAECVDAYGDTLYAHVQTALPEYYDKCGGTDMQFVGWSHVPATLPPDYAYNLYKQGVFTIKNMGAVFTDPEWAYPD